MHSQPTCRVEQPLLLEGGLKFFVTVRPYIPGNCIHIKKFMSLQCNSTEQCFLPTDIFEC